MTTRYFVVLGVACALYALAVFLAAVVFEVYAQRWSPPRSWAVRVLGIQRVLLVLLLVGVVAVTLVTNDLLLAVLIAAVWFAMSMTLKVVAGLLLRRAR